LGLAEAGEAGDGEEDPEIDEAVLDFGEGVAGERDLEG